MAHIIDSQFYGDGYSTAEMRQIFDDVTRYQRWLDVEAALADTQAELGVIPAEAAEEIKANAQVDRIDLDRVAQGVKKTNHSLVPLLREVQGLCRDSLGEFIHYGATTQDIQDTASSLEMRDVLDVAQRDLTRIAELLLGLAQTHRDTLMAGRTHGQQAMATTFGYRVSIWLREVIRHLERLQQARPRIAVASLFGGVGTMSVLPDGVSTLQGLARRLGLHAPTVSWHTARDGVAEMVSLLAMVSGTLGKIANDIYVLAKNEVGELSEGHTEGKVGSSTMPHKRNPELAEQVALLARLSRYGASKAMEAMVVEHDRDGRAWRMDWISIPETACYTGAALSLTINLLEGLEVHADRMRDNLSVQGDFLASEALMMLLGKSFGKQTAHHLVYQAAMRAHDAGSSLIAELLATDVLEDYSGREALKQLADPASQLGAAQELTDRAIELSRRDLQRIEDQ